MIGVPIAAVRQHTGRGRRQLRQVDAVGQRHDQVALWPAHKGERHKAAGRPQHRVDQDLVLASLK